MKFSVRHLLLLGVACLAPMYADSLVITSPGYGGTGNVMGGVYVNPYDAKYTNSSGVVSNVSVFCDDFYAHVSIGSPWQVNTINFDDLAANLNLTRWGNPSLGYKGTVQDAVNMYYEAAWLTSQLVSAPTNAAKGQISFAIWGLFAPTSLNSLNSGDRTQAQWWIDLAKDKALKGEFTASQFSNYVLYSPTPLTVPGSPQEFISVRTPEPGVIAVWAVNLLAVAGMISLLRKKVSVH